MGVQEVGNTLTLFNMDFLSSVTAMVLAVNLITQVIKEVFLKENISKKIPKLITLLASMMVVGAHHYRLFVKTPSIFDSSIVELIFLIFLNTVFIAALSMGNYKILNLTKDKEMKKLKQEMVKKEIEANHMKKEDEERGELY